MAEAVEATEESVTRLIVMGSAALTEGFALIGFETWPNAREEELDSLLGGLLDRRERALVFLEPYLARCNCAALQRIRNEGGRVVITEVPPLHAPGDYHPMVEELVLSVLGPAALEDHR